MSQVTRRRLLGTGVAAAGLGAFAVAGYRSLPSDQAGTLSDDSTPTRPPANLPRKRPNIIVILADDMGFSDIGCFGSEIATPNLDRMAASGRRFTHMHNNPRCCPSRASLLTGLYPTQTGVGYMTQDQGSPEYQGYLNRSCMTLGEALGRVGYRTAIVGKWHVAPNDRLEDWPAHRGFERSYCQMGGGDYYRPNLYEDGRPIGTPSDPDYFITTAVTDKAIGYIESFSLGDDPFLLYVGYKNPHFPLQAPDDAIAPYRGRYSKGWDDLRNARWARTKAAGVVSPQWRLPNPTHRAVPWHQATNRAWQASRMEVYAAQVALMDAGVGRILDSLERAGIRDDTLVLFMSDNGACAEEPNPKKRSDVETVDGRRLRPGNIPGVYPGPSGTFQSYGLEWANASNTPFRKYKRWTEEGGISTPFLASWPGRLPAGGTDDRFMHLIDIVPTVLDVAGADYPDEYDGHRLTPLAGRSFAPILAGAPDGAGWQRDSPCFWEHMGHRAAWQGHWKIVSDQPAGPFELYDMTADRTETRDLAAANPDVAAELAQAWQSWKARTGVLTWHPKRGYRSR